MLSHIKRFNVGGGGAGVYPWSKGTLALISTPHLQSKPVRPIYSPAIYPYVIVISVGEVLVPKPVKGVPVNIPAVASVNFASSNVAPLTGVTAQADQPSQPTSRADQPSQPVSRTVIRNTNSSLHQSWAANSKMIINL